MHTPTEYCFWCMHRLPSPDAKCSVCGRENLGKRKNGDDQLPFALLAKKYLVGHALGRGGFGITYVGLNWQLEKRVAIKEYYPDEIAGRASDRIHVIASSPEYNQNLQEGMTKALEEARVIARVQSVPHVVRIYDCFGRNNTVYIVMEFIDGETLAERIEKKGRLSWDEAWKYMQPIAAALDTLHRQGLIHRDISPDNIMVSREDGNSVLLDFGAASSQIHTGEARDKLLKDGYAAPEQYQAQSAIDGRADEYSWAATFLFLLTGKRPGNALQRQFTAEEEFWKPYRKVMPGNTRKAFQKALALNPNERYESIGELAGALEQKPKMRSAGRTALKIAAAAAALCTAGSMAIGLWGG